MAPSNVGDYVYAISNNGFWDCGDDMIVGRVARSHIGRLRAADWEYFTGGNGDAASWTGNMDRATPVLRGLGEIWHDRRNLSAAITRDI